MLMAAQIVGAPGDNGGAYRCDAKRSPLNLLLLWMRNRVMRRKRIGFFKDAFSVSAP